MAAPVDLHLPSTRQCPTCGRAFTPKTRRCRYCSDPCRARAAYRRRVGWPESDRAYRRAVRRAGG
jgi:hypothetical protein